MVRRPLDWEIANPKLLEEVEAKVRNNKMTDSEVARTVLEKQITLSDIRGGYVHLGSGEMYNRFNILTTRNPEYFNLYFNYQEFLHVAPIMNGLQSQPFVVNSDFLNFIKANRPAFEEAGLLSPEKLAHINMAEACLKLRDAHFNNEKDINKACSLDYLLAEFQRRVQRARYDDFVIKLASAYEGYTFYLPAFLDFRGRIYRAGILHFHERDLSKSLIMFKYDFREYDSCDLPPLSFTDLRDHLSISASFKYKKFDNYNEALTWYNDVVKMNYHHNDKKLIQFAAEGSDPFQFISKVLTIRDESLTHKLWLHPVTQDASASAYQIMSYLLLNIKMAKLTNLIPNKNGLIEDMYLSLRKELIQFLKDKFPENTYKIIEKYLTRSKKYLHALDIW